MVLKGERAFDKRIGQARLDKGTYRASNILLCFVSCIGVSYDL